MADKEEEGIGGNKEAKKAERTREEELKLRREELELEELEAKKAERARVKEEKERKQFLAAQEEDKTREGEKNKKKAEYWSKFRGEDNGTTWIILALIIVIIDLSPFGIFGERYSGFDITLFSLKEIDVIAIITGTAFTTLLSLNLLFRFFHKDFSIIPFFLLMLLINKSGVALGTLSYNQYYNYIAIAIIIVLFFVLKHFKIGQGVRLFSQDDIAYLLLAFVYSFFLLDTSWVDLKPFLHFIFITAFGYLFISSKEDSDSSSYYTIIFLLLIDFLGYNLFKNIPAFRFIPFFFFFVVVYIHKKTQNKFAAYTGTGMLIVIILASLGDVDYSSGLSQFWANRAEAPLTFSQRIFGIGERISTSIEKRLELATGGLYKSQVEKNQFEPLGVFFDRVKAAQPRFYRDEEVTIWGTIRSKTLSDPVTVKFNCFREQDDKRVDADINNADETKKDIVDPKEPFTIYTLEETDVQCIFNKNKMKTGINKVALSAEYNFETSAYQKVYFMDKERYRAMVRESLEPLKEFGITDRAPATIYTNGPVELAVDLQHFTQVGSDKNTAQNLGILLKNRDKITDKLGKPIGQWQGKIKNINELVIVVPKGVTIDGEGCRPITFLPIENPVEYCSSSCKEFSHIEGDTSCIKKCQDFFTDETSEDGTGQGRFYNGYNLNIEEIEQVKSGDRDSFENIEKGRYKTFGCRLNINKDVLDDVPITTKFIRIKARYDYSLEQTYDVRVDERPEVIAPSTLVFDSNIKKEVYFNKDSKSKISENEKKYSDLVYSISQECDIDYLFIKAIIQKENSRWDPTLVGDSDSPLGLSYGLMQVLRTTAEGKELNCNKYGDYKTNPDANINCGCSYIKYLIKKQKEKGRELYMGDIAGAYNCGEKALDRRVWQDDSKCKGTKKYVADVIKNYNQLLELNK